MISFNVILNNEHVGAVYASIKSNNEESTCVAGLASFTLSEQLKLLGIEEQYPSAVLANIEIDVPHQRRGLGSAALTMFEYQAAKAGCRFSLCKVGYESYEQMLSNLEFYKKNGWSPFIHNDDVRVLGTPTEESWCLAYKALNLDMSAPIFPRELSFSPLD